MYCVAVVAYTRCGRCCVVDVVAIVAGCPETDARTAGGQVRISARNSAAAADLVSSLADEHPGVRFVYCESAQQCVDGADVINTTTASPEPVLMDAWVANTRVHINGK